MHKHVKLKTLPTLNGLNTSTEVPDFLYDKLKDKPLLNWHEVNILCGLYGCDGYSCKKVVEDK